MTADFELQSLLFTLPAEAIDGADIDRFNTAQMSVLGQVVPCGRGFCNHLWVAYLALHREDTYWVASGHLTPMGARALHQFDPDRSTPWKFTAEPLFMQPNVPHPSRPPVLVAFLLDLVD